MSTRGAPARHRARSDGAPVSAWTGRDEFDLRSESGESHGLMEIIVRLDTVSMWTRRLVAEIDRDELRAWLLQRRQEFAVHDVVWTVHRGRIAIRLPDAGPYPVPDRVVAHVLRSA
jgi:hypothetical protein